MHTQTHENRTDELTTTNTTECEKWRLLVSCPSAFASDVDRAIFSFSVLFCGFLFYGLCDGWMDGGSSADERLIGDACMHDEANTRTALPLGLSETFLMHVCGELRQKVSKWAC